VSSLPATLDPSNLLKAINSVQRADHLCPLSEPRTRPDLNRSPAEIRVTSPKRGSNRRSARRTGTKATSADKFINKQGL
jgi:hypothetical protein